MSLFLPQNDVSVHNFDKTQMVMDNKNNILFVHYTGLL